MLTYSEKIVRKYKVCGGETPRFFLGQERARLLRKGFDEMHNVGWRYGVEKLSLQTLVHFYQQLYIPFINKKENAKLHSLVDRYASRIEAKAVNDQIFFGFVRNEIWVLLAGGIFISKWKSDSTQKTASLGFRAYDDTFSIYKQKLWNFIEFLFFEWALAGNHQLITRGQDRNGVWALGGSVGLALHKIEEHFLPYVPEYFEPRILDVKLLSQPTLFFLAPNWDGQCTKVCLFLADKRDDLAQIQSLFAKRGLDLCLC